jgi:hypothetical protein
LSDAFTKSHEQARRSLRMNRIGRHLLFISVGVYPCDWGLSNLSRRQFNGKRSSSPCRTAFRKEPTNWK